MEFGVVFITEYSMFGHFVCHDASKEDLIIKVEATQSHCGMSKRTTLFLRTEITQARAVNLRLLFQEVTKASPELKF